MNAYQRAMKHLKEQACYQREEYKKIDKLIEPLCILLNQHGYITLHSCSTHIGEKERNSNQWYVLFVATKPIKQIQQIVKHINKKHNYQIQVKDSRKLGRTVNLTRRWAIEYFLHDVKTKEKLIQINQNIYHAFVSCFQSLENHKIKIK